MEPKWPSTALPKVLKTAHSRDTDLSQKSAAVVKPNVKSSQVSDMSPLVMSCKRPMAISGSKKSAMKSKAATANILPSKEPTTSLRRCLPSKETSCTSPDALKPHAETLVTGFARLKLRGLPGRGPRTSPPAAGTSGATKGSGSAGGGPPEPLAPTSSGASRR